MLLQVPKVLDADQVAQCRRMLDEADWADGRITAGYQSAQAKHNLQLPETSATARELGDRVLSALQRQPTFLSASLKRRSRSIRLRSACLRSYIQKPFASAALMRFRRSG